MTISYDTITDACAVTVPDPPTNVTATHGSVIVSWTPPVNTGGGAITGYIVTEHPTGATYNAGATATTLSVTCPVPGTYTYTVQATNSAGSSAASASSNPLTVTAACAASVTAVEALPNVTG